MKRKRRRLRLPVRAHPEALGSAPEIASNDGAAPPCCALPGGAVDAAALPDVAGDAPVPLPAPEVPAVPLPAPEVPAVTAPAPAAAPVVERDLGSVLVLRGLDDVRRYLTAFSDPRMHRFADLPQVTRRELLERAPADLELHRLAELAQRLGVPLVDADALGVDPAATALVPAPLARKLGVVPVAATEGFLAVAASDLGAADVAATLEFLGSRRVVFVLARAALVRGAMSLEYDRVEDEALIRRLGIERGGDAIVLPHEAERLSAEQPVVKLVHGLIEQAVLRRASDLHLRPGIDDFEVLYRIDGELVPVRRFLKPLQSAVVSRMKVIGAMNLAEHRVPQDGRATFAANGANVDLRLSLVPTVNGESVVIRLLDARQSLRDLSAIGFGPTDEQRFRDLLLRNHGIVLVTGPTGCGKSTTLYAALGECRKQNVNILTVEDPVEYHITDVQQVQVNRAAGLTFPRALRNFLRHDPDVIMVGEIRDRETAEIAVESALTGHLVFSTLHTNNAATAVTRLLDLGVEPFLLKSSLLAVLAQRLARRNCPHCLTTEPVDPHIRELMGVGADETFHVGAGCPQCDGTGVRGRAAVYELLEVTPVIRDLIVPDADATAIHERARRDGGMRTITEHALALARTGTISLREAFVTRVE